MGMKRVLLGFAVTAGAVALTAVSVQAHHAFAAEFDASRPVKVKGTIAMVQWTNPHSWFHVDVKTPDGKVERWMFEGGGPGALTRRGFNKESIPVGTEVVVEGYLSKAIPRRANARSLQYTDGRTLFVGSSGTGEPDDGRDPSQTNQR